MTLSAIAWSRAVCSAAHALPALLCPAACTVPTAALICVCVAVPAITDARRHLLEEKRAAWDHEVASQPTLPHCYSEGGRGSRSVPAALRVRDARVPARVATLEQKSRIGGGAE